MRTLSVWKEVSLLRALEQASMVLTTQDIPQNLSLDIKFRKAPAVPFTTPDSVTLYIAQE